MMSRRDIVVIGASAGGVNALLTLVKALPPGFPAAVLIVLHIGSHRSMLPALLTSRGSHRAIHPQDGERLAPGTIYVAPPAHHMLIDADGEGDVVRLTRGAKEHHARPAIDPLFRSAALACGPRVIGVILTGRQDDGTAGLQAVKACGGITVVQDPADAEEPGMPTSALRHVQVDHCVPLRLLGDVLARIAGQPIEPVPDTPPTWLAEEHAVATAGADPVQQLNAIGRPSTFSCPECNGVLWEIENSKPVRYRCHTGHAFSITTLEATQLTATEDALWGAIRALQEREALLRRLAAESREGGDAVQAQAQAKAHEAAAERMLKQVLLLVRIVLEGQAHDRAHELSEQPSPG